MSGLATAIVVAVLAVPVPARAQDCLHGASETPEQRARRVAAVGAARTINTLQANRPNREGGYLELEELARLYQQQTAKNPTAKPLNFAAGGEILPGWTLAFAADEKGYWFMIKDTTDPCGFALISNEAGLIYRAEPLQ